MNLDGSMSLNEAKSMAVVGERAEIGLAVEAVRRLHQEFVDLAVEDGGIPQSLPPWVGSVIAFGDIAPVRSVISALDILYTRVRELEDRRCMKATAA